MDIYVYEIEVNENVIRQIDENQFVVESVDKIKPTNVTEHKAIEIKEYYKLINWTNEAKAEFRPKIK